MEGIELLNKEELDFIELNISCPNVKEGGMAFCMDNKSAYDITKAVKEKSVHPIIEMCIRDSQKTDNRIINKMLIPRILPTIQIQ